MKDIKREKILDRLKRIEQALLNAQEYVEQNVNVKSSAQFHLADWRGKSGHPLWMRNYMIPAMMKSRVRNEEALKTIENRSRDRALTKRRRQGAR